MSAAAIAAIAKHALPLLLFVMKSRSSKSRVISAVEDDGIIDAQEAAELRRKYVNDALSLPSLGDIAKEANAE